MTVSNTTVTTSSNGTGTNGSDGAFSFAIGNIKFSDNSDLDVYIRDVGESPPTEALKTITTHYFITDSSGNQVNPGTHIRFDTSAGHSRPLNDQKVVVKRKVELTQSTDYASGDAFPADSHEDALDKLTLLVQQMQEQLDRAWTYPETYSTLANVKMPEPANDGIIKYNADATALVLDTDLVNSTYKLYASNTSDTTAGFLNDKLAAGTGLSKSNTDGVENQQVTLSVDLKTSTDLNENSASHAASQRSIKTYVDAVTTSLGLQDLDFSGDSGGAQSVDLDTQSLTVEGGTGIDTTGSSQKISVAIDSTVTTNSGTQTLTNKTLTSPKLNEDVAITATATEVNILDGVTASTSELNIMDGVTATTSELNIMDGVTSTASELNILDGVTSTASELNILDGVTASTSELNIMDGVTASTSELNIMDGVTASTSELNIMDGVTASTSELNIMDGVTSTASELNILDGVTSTATELNILDGVTASTSEINVLDGATAGTNVASKALVVDSNKKINELIQNYGEFKHQGSDPANATASQDVRLYAKDSKLYTKDNSGTVTELGAGGGVGSIDTIFTLQAKTADAVSDASGDDAVFRGAAASITSAPTLDTTAGKLINTEKVFKYTSASGSTNDWWLYSQAIPQGYQNRNMVLQLQYYMVETSGDNLDQAFRFVARDATNGKVTQLNGAVSSSNTITLDAFADGDFTVGDRVTFKDTGGAIHFRYITSVTHGSEQLTISGATVSIADDAYFVSGILTDELDYLPNFKPTTAGQDGSKAYRKQLAIPSNCDTLEFGFHYLGSQTDQFLYYDDIALSANQFLQTSSQGQTECYVAHNQSTFWGASGASDQFNKALLSPGPGTPALADSKLIEITDVSSDTRIIARQRIELNVSAIAAMNTGQMLKIYNSDDEMRIGAQNPDGTSAAAYVEVTEVLVLEKNDYIYFKTDAKGSQYGAMTLTATPQVNDVILLNSQDEIFTDWQVYTPAVSGGLVDSSGSANGSFGSTITYNKWQWRRIGGDMEVRWDYKHTAAGSAGSGAYYMQLPSGYDIDYARLPGSVNSAVGSVVGVGIISNASGHDLQYYTQPCYPAVDTTSGNLVAAHTNDINSSNLDGEMYPTGWSSGHIHFNTGGIQVSLSFKVPIAGWTSTFNPVLSMPLVDIGGAMEYCHLYNTSGSTGGYYQKIPYFGATQKNTVSSLGTITNSSSEGCYFTASQRVKVTSNVWLYSNATNYFTVGYAHNITTAEKNTNIGSLPDYKIIAQSDGSNNTSNIGRASSCSIILEPGETLTPSTEAEGIASDSGAIIFTVEKDYSNTNMAHIIKPAVCIIEDHKSPDTGGGAMNSSSSSTLNLYDRVLNTFKGETWFVTPGSGTLGRDGNNTTFSLIAGTYELTAKLPSFYTARTIGRLYNVTDSVIQYQGQNGDAAISGSVSINIFIDCVFTITKTTEFKFQTAGSSTIGSASDVGLGLDHGNSSYLGSGGGDEIYTTVKIRKLK